MALGATVGTALVVMLMSVAPAHADYAPSNADIVGVSSVSSQYAMDFLANGDDYGDNGYDQLGNKSKLVSFDATADANGRLSYGVDGGQSGQSGCTPGTGGEAGSANASGQNTGVPCVLNPTVVLRAGTQAVQRPSSSAAAYQALVQDDIAGDNAAGHEEIQFATVSALQTEPSGLPDRLDAVIIGDDVLEMVGSSGVSNAIPLSAAQLKMVYGADAGSCVTWDEVGGFVTDPIIPLIPPPGSGARSLFLAQIGLSNPGTCAVVAEQDDPTAVLAQSQPADAIEPMSKARLDLYSGQTATGETGGLPGGYFLDPSCAYLGGDPVCGSGSVSGGTWSSSAVGPGVQALAGTTSDGGQAFAANQPLYLYFRHSDIGSTVPFEPGLTANWLNALFYNPCQAGETCDTQAGVTYGPGGPPYTDLAAGQGLLEDAGILPVNTDLPSSYFPG